MFKSSNRVSTTKALLSQRQGYPLSYKIKQIDKKTFSTGSGIYCCFWGKNSLQQQKQVIFFRSEDSVSTSARVLLDQKVGWTSEGSEIDASVYNALQRKLRSRP